MSSSKDSQGQYIIHLRVNDNSKKIDDWPRLSWWGLSKLISNRWSVSDWSGRITENAGEESATLAKNAEECLRIYVLE